MTSLHFPSFEASLEVGASGPSVGFPAAPPGPGFSSDINSIDKNICDFKRIIFNWEPKTSHGCGLTNYN